jgi:integrase/recombinase XerD
VGHDSAGDTGKKRETASLDGLSGLFAEVCEAEKSRRTQRGMRSFRQCLRGYLAWLSSQAVDPAEVGPREAEAFQAHLAGAQTPEGGNYAPGSIRNYIKAARACHGYLVLVGRATDNPFKDLRKIVYRHQPVANVLNEVQMARLLSWFARFDLPTDRRLRLRRYKCHVAAELMYASGLRICEVAALAVADLDLEERRIVVREDKEGGTRIAYLTREAVAVVSRFIECGRDATLRAFWREGGDCLFGCRLSAFAHEMNGELSLAATELALPKVTSHCFRHSLGYHLLRAGCDLRHIQAILGHRNIDTTRIYTRVDKTDLAAVLDRCHPRRLHPPKERRAEDPQEAVAAVMSGPAAALAASPA